MELCAYSITDVSSTKIFRSLSDLALGMRRKIVVVYCWNNLKNYLREMRFSLKKLWLRFVNPRDSLENQIDKNWKIKILPVWISQLVATV